MNIDMSDDPQQSPLDQVSDDAFVLRRVHKNDVELTLPVAVLPSAFRPSPSDTDGLSVYLDDKQGGPTPNDLAAAGRGGADSYVVVSLRVSELRGLGLSVIAKDVSDGFLGHAVIPELNVTDYKASKQSKRVQKVLQMKLCELASQAIVYPPDFV